MADRPCSTAPADDNTAPHPGPMKRSRSEGEAHKLDTTAANGTNSGVVVVPMATATASPPPSAHSGASSHGVSREAAGQGDTRTPAAFALMRDLPVSAPMLSRSQPLKALLNEGNPEAARKILTAMAHFDLLCQVECLQQFHYQSKLRYNLEVHEARASSRPALIEPPPPPASLDYLTRLRTCVAEVFNEWMALVAEEFQSGVAADGDAEMPLYEDESGEEDEDADTDTE